MDELDALLQRRLALLEEKTKAEKLEKDFVRKIRNDFKLQYFASAVVIYLRLPSVNKPSASYVLKLDSLGHWLINTPELVGCSWYVEALEYYYHFKVRDQPQEHPSPAIYKYYEVIKQLPVKQAELLRNLVLRKDCDCFTEEEFNDLSADFERTCSQKDLVEEFRNFLKIRENQKKITYEIGDQRLLAADGSEIKFRDLLENNGASLFYLDFWASWCKPCIFELPNSKS